MRRYRIEVSRSLLDDLERYELALVGRVSAERAQAIVATILAAARSLETAPIRGTDWSEVEAGLRSLPIDRRGTLVFQVDRDAGRVRLLGWWWRGAPIAGVVERYRAK